VIVNIHKSSIDNALILIEAFIVMLQFAYTLFAFVLGSAAQLFQPALSSWALYSAILLAAGVFIILFAIKNIANSMLIKGFAVFSTVAALGFSQVGLRAVLYQQQALLPSLEGVDLRVTGVVAAMPQPGELGLRFRLDVESAYRWDESGLKAVKLPQRLALAWYKAQTPSVDSDVADPYAELRESTQLKAGERWQLTVRLKAPHGNLNPHGFDYELWLWEQGIGATGYVRTGQRKNSQSKGVEELPSKIGETWAHPVEAVRQRVREAIFQRVADRGLAGIIAALVVGDQAAIERSDWDIFRATGVAHLMSISGLHITMFAWGAALLVASLWRRSTGLTTAFPAQHAALIGGIALASMYALFAGWGVPAQRTVVMLCTVALLRLLGKRWPWPLIWLLSCAVIVAFDPWALLSAGFWLSFVAVGILFAAGPAVRAPSQKIWPRLKVMLREQWLISLALAPLSLLLFAQVSLVGLLANLVAIPWVTLIVTPLALLGVLFAPLWDMAALAVHAQSGILGYLAGLPFATISIAKSPIELAALGVIGGVLLMIKVPIAWRVLGACMIVPMLLYMPARPHDGEFSVLAVDVGQGNALLVQTAQKSLLYDTGARYSSESDAGQRTLVPLLRSLGEKLDVVMVSHSDSDHSGGAHAVLSMQRQARLMTSAKDDHDISRLRQAERCEQGIRWDWSGVSFEILHPQASDYNAEQKPNAMSCVLRVSNGTQTVLLTGDLEAAQEQRLVQAGANLKADVLLVPHHGSKTSSTPIFLDAVSPSIAIVQAGYRNRFQHPAAEVMDRYAERKIKIVSTPGCGAGLWKSDEPGVINCQRTAQPRYWHHQMNR
jgi:competence protein ComEC